jgi:hypothetical protein
MKWLFALVPLAAAAPTLNTIQTGEAPPAGQVKIRGVSYGGTGCPQGTVGALISSDQSTMTLIFDSYVASLGPGVAVTENRKNCQLAVDIQYPGGFQYSILSADYRGYASIEKGITGTLKSTYYFSGQQAQSTTEQSFVGPINGDYLKSDKAESTSTVMSPCGASGILNINSQVRLVSTLPSTSPNKPSGVLTNDSTDLKFTQVVSVQWQKCNK